MILDTFLSCFSRNYAQAREKFLGITHTRGLAVESHLLNLAGSAGEPLAMDVVWDGPKDATRLLLTTSGVHGVEGFCGSGVQCALMTLRPDLGELGDTAILHVHAVNPYGFSHLRRATQENVDHNRNFIDFTQPLPSNADYQEIHSLLLPSQWPPAQANEEDLDAFRQQWGPRRMQQAISGGQHTHANGMFYGGIEPTWSNRIFRDILRCHTRTCEHLAWIDVHTGLGPHGLGERIFASDDSAEALARSHRWWGDDVSSEQTGTSTSIPLLGPIQRAVEVECPQAVYTGICLEFGTVPLEATYLALRAEHWLTARPSAEIDEAKVIKQALRDAFYPDTDVWKRQVLTQAFEAASQAIQGLRNSRTIDPQPKA